MLEPGTLLKDRYELRDAVGKGGYSTVYSAWDKVFERTVAIKIVDIDVEKDQSHTTQELLKEVRYIATIRHPNIIDVYDYGDVDGQPYVVMPYADGGNLFQILQKNGPLSFKQAASYLQQIASGLDYAHSLKVVHRDLKPQNFLLFGPDRQQLAITDFGVAKMGESGNLTRVIGTPRYMAPEQFSGRVSYSSDIYALGVLLYQMLTGETPFKGDFAAQEHSHTSVLPPTLSSKRPDASPKLDDLLRWALEKDPSRRPRSAGELAHFFQQAADRLPVSDQVIAQVNEALQASNRVPDEATPRGPGAIPDPALSPKRINTNLDDLKKALEHGNPVQLDQAGHLYLEESGENFSDPTEFGVPVQQPQYTYDKPTEQPIKPAAPPPITRYADVRFPEKLRVGQQALLEVALTLTEAVVARVSRGEDSGELELDPVTVEISAPGYELLIATPVQTIELVANRNTTPVKYLLETRQQGEQTISLTFWQKGKLVHRVDVAATVEPALENPPVTATKPLRGRSIIRNYFTPSAE